MEKRGKTNFAPSPKLGSMHKKPKNTYTRKE